MDLQGERERRFNVHEEATTDFRPAPHVDLDLDTCSDSEAADVRVSSGKTGLEGGSLVPPYTRGSVSRSLSGGKKTTPLLNSHLVRTRALGKAVQVEAS